MEKKFCYRCMENYDGFKTVCPHCGYDENSSYNNMYLAPGTVLHDRYIVGVLLRYNGEGATYIAYDKVISCKVLLREYMPINLCVRVTDKPIISVNYNNLAKYKAFMAEYTELNKSLARLRNNTNINPTLDMFAENNTTYTVSEYVEGYKLLDYLKENAGELTWEQVSKLFPPLFTTIGIIHNAGIIHRAISPETVYVTTKGEIKLSGFCISSVRTIGGGLETELFKGYAAPEQYSSSSSSRQGTWTDVYGLSALLYRMLTGCMPTESTERLDNDNLCEPFMLNPNIPKHVSRAIMDGMNVSGRNRIQTVTELVTRLFEQVEEENVNPYNNYNSNYKSDTKNIQRQHYTQNYNNVNERTSTYINNINKNRPENTNTFSNNKYRNDYNNYNNYDDYNYYDERTEYENKNEEYEYEKVGSNTIDRIKIPIIIGILLLAILLILGITLLNVLAPQNGNEETSSGYSSMDDNIIEASSDTTTEEPVTEVLDGVVPDLQNKFFELTQSKYQDFISLEAEYEYNDDYDIGQIFWQEFEAGSAFKIGSVMKVKVSLGSARISIPDYYDCSISEYEARLSDVYIDNYEFIEEEAYDVSPNTVTRLAINGNTVYAGDILDKSNGEKLTVYYAKYVETETEPPTTEEPTTTVTTEEITESTTQEPVYTEEITEQPTEENTNEYINPDDSSYLEQGDNPEDYQNYQ